MNNEQIAKELAAIKDALGMIVGRAGHVCLAIREDGLWAVATTYDGSNFSSADTPEGALASARDEACRALKTLVDGRRGQLDAATQALAKLGDGR